jgi:hypothetical protein
VLTYPRWGILRAQTGIRSAAERSYSAWRCCALRSASVGAGQQIADGHPGAAGPVKDSRIAELYFLLHGIAAGIGRGCAPKNGSAQLPRVDENIYVALRSSAVHLSQQLLSEVIGRNHLRSSNPTTRLIHAYSQLIQSSPV